MKTNCKQKTVSHSHSDGKKNPVRKIADNRNTVSIDNISRSGTKMAKYHVNKDGQPAVCKARKGKCPLGGDGDHIVTNDIKEAREFAEVKNAKDVGSGNLTSIEKEVPEETDSDETKTNPYADLSIEEAEALLEERVNSEEYRELVANRDEAKEKWFEAKERSKKVASAYYRNRIENNHGKLRKARHDQRDAYYDHIVAKKELEDYKDETALIAARLSEEAFEVEYEGETLGNAVRTVEYPSGSREWLEQRQQGIGGSDAGDIFRVDPEWHGKNYRRVEESKIKPITDEEVAEQELNNSEFSGAQGRGNAWEPLIAKQFGDENPQYELIHSKSSWVNKDRPWQFANFDGILKDKETGEYGILEIKTASDASKWENGVPPGYRTQVLHYLDTTGFDYAHVAVMIDDNDYRSFRVSKDDPVSDDPNDKRTYADRREELEEFHNRVQQARKEGKEMVNSANQKSTFNWGSTAARNVIVKDLAAFSQEDEATIQKRIQAKVDAETQRVEKLNESIDAENRANKDTIYKKRRKELRAQHPDMSSDDLDKLTAKETSKARAEVAKPRHKVDYDKIVREEWSSVDPSKLKKDIVSIDLETSAEAASQGEIIEVGVTRTNAKGEVVDKYQALFDIDDRAKKAYGTGAEDVHNISVKDIEDNPRFTESKVQQRMRDVMGIDRNGNSDAVMLAHNANFEKQWLNQYLEGFHKSGMPVIDSMRLARYFDHDTKDNTLESFAENRGVKYPENAHRALVDAEVTKKAYDNFVADLTGKAKRPN